MLQLSKLFYNRRILSLRTGLNIGLATDPIINPDNLRLEGWYVVAGRRTKLVILIQDVRELISKGIVVDDEDVLTDPEELVRLKNVINLHFKVLGKEVVTDSKQKVGKVIDYSVDDGSLYIQNLYVQSGALFGLTKSPRIISRDQIVEITDKKIIVSDTKEKAGAPATATA